MMTLKEILLTDDSRPRVVNDCVQLVDDEVRKKRGLAAVAVKGAYTVVKKVKPSMIKEAVERLLDDFVAAVESFHQDFVKTGTGDFAAFLIAHQGEIADALLGVTDRRIANAQSKTIQKAYGKLRPTGEKHVQEAVPGIGRVMAKYL